MKYGIKASTNDEISGIDCWNQTKIFQNWTACFFISVTFIDSKKTKHTLREEIFAGRKFREFCEFWPNSRNWIPFLTPENADSRKLIPAKFFKIGDSRKLIPAKFSKLVFLEKVVSIWSLFWEKVVSIVVSIYWLFFYRPQ